MRKVSQDPGARKQAGHEKSHRSLFLKERLKLNVVGDRDSKVLTDVKVALGACRKDVSGSAALCPDSCSFISGMGLFGFRFKSEVASKGNIYFPVLLHCRGL